MRWTFSIKNKLGASIVLLALCLLVLLSNYLDRLHTENVKNSISTMYEDRLIVEELILKMTRNVYQIREILNTEDHEVKVNTFKKLTVDIKATYNIFIKTRLTKNEKITADELITQIQGLEQSLFSTNNLPSIYTDKILSSLNKLSQIQLSESKLIMKQVEAQYATIKASSQFALAIIIIILLVLQVMVFSGESLIPRFKPKDPTLN
ncbi:MCP four helix bundle domain-containing protein [Flavobacterium sp.]|uniref:MCP four helix bundle domain-containing protein n=1 Tax=Flavobacterium sp. TaxID=239 RepID=UPI002BCA2651|nr:MCP four helix bundle domain-containing protein [Flavobacterium sp.]HQA75167.1 MCP four helix bundle domain-containing protein [Flavobacterium sp.]